MIDDQAESADDPDVSAADDAADTDLWEDHADWWQRQFTEGADPEYTEQILPLAD